MENNNETIGIRAPGLSGSRSGGKFSADFLRSAPSTGGFVANCLSGNGKNRSTLIIVFVKKVER